MNTLAAFQLSHAELLVLLALLDLPPLALIGPHTTLGLHTPARSIAFAGAYDSLIARELIDSHDQVVPELAATLRQAASGPQQILLIGRHRDQAQLYALSWGQPGGAVLHTRTARFHRFDRQACPADLIALIQALAPADRRGAPLVITPPLLSALLSDCECGDQAAAQDRLIRAGYSSAQAAALVGQLGVQPGRYSLLSVDTCTQTTNQAAILIQGAQACWWGSITNSQTEHLCLNPIDRPHLEAAVTAFCTASGLLEEWYGAAQQ